MGWKLGLKTGMYYLRTKPAAAAIKFTVDKEKTPVSHKIVHTKVHSNFKLFSTRNLRSQQQIKKMKCHQ